MDIQWLLKLPQRISESGQRRSTVLELRAGDQIQASVLDVLSRNDALLSIGQFKAYARMPRPVVTGQQVRVNVVASGSDLRLLVVPAGTRPTSAAADGRSEIRLFEPVSDRPFLTAHAQALTPGDTLKGRITGFERDGQHLVDFGRFKVFTKIDIPVRQGQIVPLTVLKSDAGLALTVAPDENRSPTASMLPLLPADRRVDGQIKWAAEASRVATAHQLLSAHPTHGQKTAAEASGHLSSPTSADMVSLGKQIQHLIERPDPTGKPIHRSLPAALLQALANLQRILTPASAVGNVEQLAVRIKDFVDNSGLYFEKRLEMAIQATQHRSQPMPADERTGQSTIRGVVLNDLKPTLLNVQQLLDGQQLELKAADRQILETVKPMVQRTLFSIDQQQALATEKPADTDGFQAFSHLLMLDEDPRNARLNVYYAKKGRDDAHKTPRVSLLLEMDRMGAVRTDMWMVDKNLNITFFVQQEEIKVLIDAEIRYIHEVLGALFETVGISVVVNRKKIAEFDGEDLSVPKQRQVDLNI